MGRIWGPGGWLGPGSWLAYRADQRWFHFLLHFLFGTLLLFLLGYFGWGDGQTAHQVFPAVAAAILGGVTMGLGRLAFDAWEARIRRRADQE